jgi:hypothetical protein
MGRRNGSMRVSTTSSRSATAVTTPTGNTNNAAASRTAADTGGLERSLAATARRTATLVRVSAPHCRQTDARTPRSAPQLLQPCRAACAVWCPPAAYGTAQIVAEASRLPADCSDSVLCARGTRRCRRSPVRQRLCSPRSPGSGTRLPAAYKPYSHSRAPSQLRRRPDRCSVRQTSIGASHRRPGALRLSLSPGTPSGARTPDSRIKNPLLCRLS